MNKFIRISIPLFAIFLVACEPKVKEVAPVKSIEEQVTEQMIEEAKQAVLSRLKDPSSAQFRNVRMIRRGQICGEVNAKNSFGGYVGFKPFKWDVTSPSDVTMIEQTTTDCL